MNGRDIMSKFVPEITVLIICFILATLPTAVCAKPDTASQDKMITENDNGNTIYIKEGHAFFLKLEENPSTGYSWAEQRASETKRIRNVDPAAWRIKTLAVGERRIPDVFRGKPFGGEPGRAMIRRDGRSQRGAEA
jgi:predicted secreted protein